VAFLNLSIDTTLVDVNVHPTKKQIRLSREKEITEMIRKSVRDALLAQDLIPAAGAPAVMMPLVPNRRLFLKNPTICPFLRHRPVSLNAPMPEPPEQTSGSARLNSRSIPHQPTSSPRSCRRLRLSGIRGDLHPCPLNGDELLLIDQHAAHERILYEQVTGLELEVRPSQELIARLSCTAPQRSAILKDLLPALAFEGSALKNLRGRVSCPAVPVVLGRIEETTIIDEIISDLVSEEAAQSVSNRERITRIVACRGRLRRAQSARGAEPEDCGPASVYEKSVHLSHGRPTMIRFTRKELDAMFKRI